MAKVELKQPIVDEISGHLKDANAVVLVDYRGLTVEQDTRLRRELREAGIVYKVYKNTMMNFAFKGTPFEELSKYLEGPSAIAIGHGDAVAVQVEGDLAGRFPCAADRHVSRQLVAACSGGEAVI